MEWCSLDNVVNQVSARLQESSVNSHSYLSSGISRVIGVYGAAGLGKTNFSIKLRDRFEFEGVTCMHLKLDGFLLPRVVRRQLRVNGYQLAGWQFVVAEKILRDLLVNGEPVSVQDYLPNGTLGVEQLMVPSSIIILDGNYSALGAVNELVDTNVFFKADTETMKQLRYERDVVTEKRFSPNEELNVWKNEVESLERNIIRRKGIADVIVCVNPQRQYSVNFSGDI